MRNFTPLVLLLAATLSLGLTTEPPPDRPSHVERYLQQFGFLAQELHQQTGIPKPIILAIAGLETNWGKSELAINANNHFGLKVKDWNGPVYCKNTREFISGQDQQLRQCFRKYPLVRYSYQDFGRYLATNKRYRQLFFYARWDYRSWAYGLQYSKYATDPEYASKLLRVIEDYQLAAPIGQR